jgi:hypothetical protein
MTRAPTFAVASALRMARKVAVAVLGFSVLTFGLVLIVLPFPAAVLVIPIGLAILATEFLWARKLLGQFRTLCLWVNAYAQQMFGKLSGLAGPKVQP